MPWLAPPACNAVAMPHAWNTASGIAPMRDHWLILRRPDSPSFWMAFMLGLMCTSSCTMMDDEIYGITFSASRLKRSRAPPENMLNMSTIVPFWLSISWSIASGLTPGTGI